MIRISIGNFPLSWRSRISSHSRNQSSSLGSRAPYSIFKDEDLNLLKDSEIVNPPRSRPLDFDRVTEEKVARVENPTGAKNTINEHGFYEEKLMAPAKFPVETKSDSIPDVSPVAKEGQGSPMALIIFMLFFLAVFIGELFPAAAKKSASRQVDETIPEELKGILSAKKAKPSNTSADSRTSASSNSTPMKSEAAGGLLRNAANLVSHSVSSKKSASSSSSSSSSSSASPSRTFGSKSTAVQYCPYLQATGMDRLEKQLK